MCKFGHCLVNCFISGIGKAFSTWEIGLLYTSLLHLLTHHGEDINFDNLHNLFDCLVLALSLLWNWVLCTLERYFSVWRNAITIAHMKLFYAKKKKGLALQGIELENSF